MRDQIGAHSPTPVTDQRRGWETSLYWALESGLPEPLIYATLSALSEGLND
jgi:hypothetical protein